MHARIDKQYILKGKSPDQKDRDKCNSDPIIYSGF